MAQEQQNIQVAAPAFAGLNTQGSPVSLPIEYASIADNCVIDKSGRISSRKGFKALPSNPEGLTTDEPIIAMQEFIALDFTSYLFVTGDLKIWWQQYNGTLVEMVLPGAYVITANNWDIIPFAGKCFFYQEGHPPLVFDPLVSTTDLARPTEEPGAGATGWPNCGTAAFGHVWAADFDSDKSTFFYSALTDGELWATGGGSCDATVAWPSGYDEITAMIAHNNFLLVFGLRSVLVYTVPADGPTAAFLTDTIEAIGCIARDSVQATGSDVLFMDASGVRSFNRTIQEKSMPIGDISRNVRTDIKRQIALVPDKSITSWFSSEESMYASTFPDEFTAYIFDSREELENGAWRPTRWTGAAIRCGYRVQDGTLYLAGRQGVYTYEGGNDEFLDADDAWQRYSVPVSMRYYTHPQFFGAPVALKFPKQLDVTLIGATTLYLGIFWAFDYSETFKSTFLERIGGEVAEYNTVGVEYDTDDEYSGQSQLLSTERVNIWGNGRNIKFGFEGTITGVQLSIQELNIQALMGRII